MSLDESYTEFLKGVEEFNGTYYFEAHDTWEAIWQELHGTDRRFLHGLIHLSIAMHHLTASANWRGADSQFEKAFTKLSGYKPVHRGLDIEAVEAHIKAHLFPFIDALVRKEKILIPPEALPKLSVDVKSA